MAEPMWLASAVKKETDMFQEPYYPALHLNGSASLFHGKERKHFPFLTDHSDTAFSCQLFTITPSSENSSRHNNGKMFTHDGGLDNCALSLLSDNPTLAQIMIPAAQSLGGAVIQYGSGDVPLTGLSYVRVENKDTSILATSTGHTASATATASAAASQLQYHGYYNVSADQGNSDGAIQALPFSSW